MDNSIMQEILKWMLLTMIFLYLEAIEKSLKIYAI